MSEKNDISSPSAVSVEGAETEAAPFELGYQPHMLPQISVPDLPPYAQGLTAETLLQVPTLTEQVQHRMDQASPPLPESSESEDACAPAPVALAAEIQPMIQDTPVQADTWFQELHVRMVKLTDEIQTLNARLDRIEAQNNAKA